MNRILFTIIYNQLIDKDKNGIFATEVFSEQQNAEQVLEILGYNKNKNDNK